MGRGSGRRVWQRVVFLNADYNKELIVKELFVTEAPIW